MSEQSAFDEDQTPLFRIRDLRVRFPRGRGIRVDALDIAPGGLIAILGPSGSGKSVLLSILGGLFPKDSELGPLRRLLRGFARRLPYLGKHDTETARLTGSVEFAPRKGPGAPSQVLSANHERLAGTIGFVFQTSHLMRNASVSANVAISLAASGHEIEEARLKELLEQLDLGESIYARARILSGGEQQRVALARAFVGDPDVIIADEPTASLDPRLAQLVMEHLREWCKDVSGRTVIWVTHSLEEAAQYADKVIVLRDGELAPGAWPRDNPGDAEALAELLDQDPVTDHFHVKEWRLEPPEAGHARKWVVKSSMASRLAAGELFAAPSVDGSEQPPWLHRLTGFLVPPAAAALSAWRQWRALGTFGRFFNVAIFAFLFCFLAITQKGATVISDIYRAKLGSPTLATVSITGHIVNDPLTVQRIAEFESMLAERGLSRTPPASAVTDGETPPDAAASQTIFGRWHRPSVSVKRVAQVADGEARPDDAVCERPAEDDASGDGALVSMEDNEPIYGLLQFMAGDSPGRLKPSGGLRVPNQSEEGIWGVLVTPRLLSAGLNYRAGDKIDRHLCINLGGWKRVRIDGIVQVLPKSGNAEFDIAVTNEFFQDSVLGDMAYERIRFEAAEIYVDPDRIQQYVQFVEEISGSKTDEEFSQISAEAGLDKIKQALDTASSVRNITITFLTASFALLLISIAIFGRSAIYENNKSLLVSRAFGLGKNSIFMYLGMQFLVIWLMAILLVAMVMIATNMFLIPQFVESTMADKIGLQFVAGDWGLTASSALLAVLVSVIVVVHSWWIENRAIAEQLQRLG